MKRERTLTVAGLVLTIAALMAGCGGGRSGPTLDADRVSATMTATIRGQLPAGATMAPLDCVQDGDREHYSCAAVIRGGGRTERYSVAVVCDSDTGKCVSRPQ